MGWGIWKGKGIPARGNSMCKRGEEWYDQRTVMVQLDLSMKKRWAVKLGWGYRDRM